MSTMFVVCFDSTYHPHHCILATERLNQFAYTRIVDWLSNHIDQVNDPEGWENIPDRHMLQAEVREWAATAERDEELIVDIDGGEFYRLVFTKVKWVD